MRMREGEGDIQGGWEERGWSAGGNGFTLAFGGGGGGGGGGVWICEYFYLLSVCVYV